MAVPSDGHGNTFVVYGTVPKPRTIVKFQFSTRSDHQYCILMNSMEMDITGIPRDTRRYRGDGKLMLWVPMGGLPRDSCGNVAAI